RRVRDDRPPAIDALLQSRDPLMRAHVARGLGLGMAATSIGRLAQAYRWETNLQVRRAIITALATREAAADPAKPPSEMLAFARDLDPDTTVRRTAAEGRSGLARPIAGVSPEVAWIRLLPAAGAAPPASVTATLVSSDGLAIPIAFDDDGFALVPGVPPGPATVRLAPLVPSYQPSPR
ncbi:MAG: hypothetical protein M3O50_13680, partial [Myxococcota bacterium]|nr:hypothetical protein [Myxococcota bacterium]